MTSSCGGLVVLDARGGDGVDERLDVAVDALLALGRLVDRGRRLLEVALGGQRRALRGLGERLEARQLVVERLHRGLERRIGGVVFVTRASLSPVYSRAP